MKTYLIIVLFVVVCLLAGSTPAFAHHGTGISYDLAKLVSVKGVVVKFALSNPHSQLYFDVTDDKGNVEHWSAEMNAPTNLVSSDWREANLHMPDGTGLRQRLSDGQ